ncbi:acyl-CoA dehydrogenase family protein [Amycolatopsis pithecellobii]|uniref:Acyl-CoA dehydrogenase n=1 Tax=Amycolatopsis pithecellobii TaxID=664692 RepID=A0A6N7Z0B0_9PSEU|nr:acyl-CoA dehydrogenase family protein [Amycolatopsis pithecellobii]MTD54703.1 acyl-CoA dehydrogenase [Amycolatopsis pithecellobii]
MTEPLVPDPALSAAAHEFFSDHAGAATEFDQKGQFPGELWHATEELGLTLIAVDESHGGSGGSLTDLLTVLMTAARYAAPLPLAETALAAYLLTSAGVAVPPGPLTIAPPGAGNTLRLSDGRLQGIVDDIPWARFATLVIALVHDDDGRAHVVAFDPSRCDREDGEDLAGMPRDRLRVEDPAVVDAITGITAADLFAKGALMRAGQMAGSLAATHRLTGRYVEDRVQFGRPIGRFQAVQAHTVATAQAAEVTAMSTWRAAAAAGRRPARFEAFAAKLVANESARVAVRAAHQAHGAIGMTREYPLHLHTRRLNSWQHEFGSERELSTAIGNAVTKTSFARTIADHNPEIEVAWPRT